MRRVLITGGSGGLGVSVTRLAVERGWHVTVPIFDEREAERLAALAGDQLAIVRGDLGDEARVSALIGEMPRIDALIHLVGGFTMGPTHELSLAAWREHFDLTLTTTFLCCKHALSRMRQAGYGRIVTIGSRAVEVPMGQAAAYSAAKAGVVALTRVIAEETKGSDITANCVLPSVIDTAANRQAMGDAETDRWVEPESLAEVVLFLASEAACDLRGAIVPVYGGV